MIHTRSKHIGEHTHILGNRTTGTLQYHIVVFLVALMILPLLICGTPSTAYASDNTENVGGVYGTDTGAITEVLASSDTSNDGDDDESNSHYLDIDMNLIGNQSTNSLIAGGATIIQHLTTTIFLPFGLLLAAWRVIYIAVFPLMSRTDPLNMMSSPRYSHTNMYNKMNRSAGKHGKLIMSDSMSHDASEILHLEIKQFLFYAVIIFAVWGILQIIMWFIVLLVGIF